MKKITGFNRGWIAEARFQTLRTEPSWNAAPDVCVVYVSKEKSHDLAVQDVHYLLRTGCQEAWIIDPDGTIHRHKKSPRDEHIVLNAPKKVHV